jgi:hypothetical protein
MSGGHYVTLAPFSNVDYYTLWYIYMIVAKVKQILDTLQRSLLVYHVS